MVATMGCGATAHITPCGVVAHPPCGGRPTPTG